MIDIMVILLLTVGVISFFTTTIGILRFPDFYARMHAAGKGDVASSLLMLVGLALYNLHELSVGALLVSLKIIAIIIFIFMASPTATHAIIDAGYESGVQPWTKESNQQEEPDDLGA